MSPRVTDEHKEARRNQIIAAAVSCFAEHGFHKTSMKDICTVAELSPGAVYNYFQSKDEIIEAVCQQSQQMNDAIFANGDDPSKDFDEQVSTTLGGFCQLMKEPMMEQFFRADLMFMGEYLTNPALAEQGHKNMEFMIKRLKQMVEGWQRSGNVNQALDAEAVARVLFATGAQIGMQKLMQPDMDIDAYFGVIGAMIRGEFRNGKKT